MKILIDKKDNWLLKAYSWHNSGSGYVCCTIPGIGCKKMLYLHHAIIGRPLGKLQVDHINRNPLDNRRFNLRIVDPGINQHNRIYPGKNPLPGVSRSGNKWVAKLTWKYKQKYLGSFDTPEEAHKNYIEAWALIENT